MADEFEFFGDESKDNENALTGERWHYAGLLAVPVSKKDELLTALDDAREGCDSELKSTDLDHLPKRRAAENWIDVILSDAGRGRVFLSLLGLNVSRLNPASFGGQRFDRIYNRFFRTNLTYACKCFSSDGHTVVHRVWHDQGQMEGHDFFPWHAIRRSAEKNGIDFRERDVRFIPSDHRKPEGRRESHLLQLVDLFTGLARQLLDDTSRKESICSVARKLSPLLRRMTKSPDNPHSRYGHKDKYVASFFPSRELTETELEDPVTRARSTIYTERALAQIERESGQLRLFD